MAVVLTWNDFEMAQRCIESLTESAYEGVRVVLVDNGSSFPTIAPIKEAFPDIEGVQLSENFGFTGGCNRGIEKALDMGADYVVLLNNDTIVHKRAVSELAAAMEAREDAAMASAILLSPGEEKRIQSHTTQSFRDRAYGVRHNTDEVFTDEFRRTVETDFAPACAVLFRASALKRVGLFDETLFTNWEDYDLCMRFTDAGYKLLVTGTAEVVHAHGQTTGKTSPFITYLSVRNRLICLFRYGRPLGILRNFPFIVRSFFWQMNEYGLTNLACHAALAKGALHALLGVRGKGGAPASRDDKSTGTKP